MATRITAVEDICPFCFKKVMHWGGRYRKQSPDAVYVQQSGKFGMELFIHEKCWLERNNEHKQ